ncbi:MAG TPA: DUF1579 domain-containing protein [Chitinophagaceae bacterium]
MKQKILVLCSATLLFVACSNDKTASESTTEPAAKAEEKKEEPWVPVDSATMMKNMMDYGTPGPMHEMLASWSGTWSGENTMWEYDGADPQKSTGTAVNTMIMGGKYQSSKHSGDMMGMPFEGMSVTGYDNATKQFTSTWVDNWSTGIMSMSGSWDASSKTLTLAGKYPDINRPGKECSLREVFKVIDDNTHYMEMYGPDPKTGKEFKMMEMKMSRKKK